MTRDFSQTSGTVFFTGESRIGMRKELCLLGLYSNVIKIMLKSQGRVRHGVRFSDGGAGRLISKTRSAYRCFLARKAIENSLAKNNFAIFDSRLDDDIVS